MSDEERRLRQQKVDDERAKEEAERQARLKKARQLVESMNINVATEMPKPLPPGTICKSKTEIETNLFGINADGAKNIYQYDIDITCDTGKKIIEFTRKGRSDYVVADRKKSCNAVFFTAIKATGCFRDDIVFFYDGQSILYTTERLVFGDPQKRNATVKLSGADVMQDLRNFEKIEFVIKECTDKFVCRLSEILRADRDIETKDRSAMQFVDVATSMYALSQSDTRFTIFGNGKIFPNNPEREGIQTVQMKEGKVMIPGMNKSIKLVEGPRGRGHASPAIAIDSLKVAFHVNETLLEKARGVMRDVNNATSNDIDTFSTMVNGLGCITTHMPETHLQRRIELWGISKEDSSFKMEIDTPNGPPRIATIEEYFNMKYGIALKFPRAPLAMSRVNGKMSMYPMELLQVLPMQRVTIPQTTPVQSQVATKECAVAPAVRQNDIIKQCQLHEFFNPEQQFLKAAGLKIIPHQLKVHGRILKGPVLKYKRGEMEVIDAAWRPPKGYQFLVPASCERWAMYAMLNPNDTFGLPEMTQFAAAFVKSCRERGMQINKPDEMEVLKHVPPGKTIDYPARMKIKDAEFHNLKFIFFITSDSITTHKHLKLQESYSRVITQDLKMTTAIKYLTKGQNQTMDNIVSKTNVKLGGIDYSINLKNVVGPSSDPFKSERLILGIGLSHAPACAGYLGPNGVKLASPTVVGYSANMANHPTEFIGDFLFQDSKKDDLLLCTPELLQNVLDRFTGRVQPDGSRLVVNEGDPTPPPPKPLPKELIIYRQGVAEGFYALCIQDEIPLVKAILARNGAPDCKLTFVVVQKEHNVRLMNVNIDSTARATSQNIGSGVVVDAGLTHPRFREFYLNSHITLQGTARTPRYTVLCDDQDLTMNELESVTHALAFNFQIVNSPVSVPAPLYIANRYAERGVALFMARNSDEMQSSEQRNRTTLEEMNEDLTYSRKNLGAKRINA